MSGKEYYGSRKESGVPSLLDEDFSPIDVAELLGVNAPSSKTYLKYSEMWQQEYDAATAKAKEGRFDLLKVIILCLLEVAFLGLAGLAFMLELSLVSLIMGGAAIALLLLAFLPIFKTDKHDYLWLAFLISFLSVGAFLAFIFFYRNDLFEAIGIIASGFEEAVMVGNVFLFGGMGVTGVSAIVVVLLSLTGSKGKKQKIAVYPCFLMASFMLYAFLSMQFVFVDPYPENALMVQIFLLLALAAVNVMGASVSLELLVCDSDREDAIDFWKTLAMCLVVCAFFALCFLCLLIASGWVFLILLAGNILLIVGLEKLLFDRTSRDYLAFSLPFNLLISILFAGFIYFFRDGIFGSASALIASYTESGDFEMAEQVRNVLDSRAIRDAFVVGGIMVIFSIISFAGEEGKKSNLGGLLGGVMCIFMLYVFFANMLYFDPFQDSFWNVVLLIAMILLDAFWGAVYIMAFLRNI